MVDTEWLVLARRVAGGIAVIRILSESPDLNDVMIRAMVDLSSHPESPFEFDNVALVRDVLIPDGVWGLNAQAAYAMLVHICETGDVPNEDSTQIEPVSSLDDDDSDVRLDSNAE